MKNSLEAAIKRSEEARKRIENKKEVMRKKGFSEEEIASNFD